MTKSDRDARYYERNRERLKAQRRQRYQEDPTSELARNAEYRSTHPEIVNEISRRYRAAHPEVGAAYARRWREANPDQAAVRGREASRRRRARMRGVIVEDFTDLEIFERDGWICGICCAPIDCVIGWPAPKSPSIDHIQPISKGGDHTRDNVQASHLRCNLRKGGRI
jgi:5-methylcytosine-specific restriction endonuclease McrA